MSVKETTASAPDYIRTPTSVLMKKFERDAGAWKTIEWLVDAVVPDMDQPQSRGVTGRMMHDDNDSAFIWQGLSLEFFKDGGESYWYNLMSEAPRLFVVVEIDESDASAIPIPTLVTASQDEAVAHMETDDIVHSVAMPASIIESLERFVVHHYVPFVKKKRKRKEWRENSDFEKRKR